MFTYLTRDEEVRYDSNKVYCFGYLKVLCRDAIFLESRFGDSEHGKEEGIKDQPLFAAMALSQAHKNNLQIFHAVLLLILRYCFLGKRSSMFPEVSLALHYLQITGPSCILTGKEPFGR